MILYIRISGSKISSIIEATAQRVADSVNERVISRGSRTNWAMDYTELVGRWAMSGDSNDAIAFIIGCLNMDSVIKGSVQEVPGPSVMKLAGGE